jgi:hypothetical protein
MSEIMPKKSSNGCHMLRKKEGLNSLEVSVIIPGNAEENYVFSSQTVNVT